MKEDKADVTRFAMGAPNLPVNPRVNCLTKHNMGTPLEGQLLEPLLTPWIRQIISQELPATSGLSVFVHSRTT